MDLESPADAPGGPSLSPPRPAQRRFQVLALDGGGVGGIFTAALLAGLEDDTGRPVVDLFDLVVGTSTGGIIALGLGAGLTPREILEFYVSEKDRIFPNRFGWRAVRQVSPPSTGRDLFRRRSSASSRRGCWVRAGCRSSSPRTTWARTTSTCSRPRTTES